MYDCNVLGDYMECFSSTLFDKTIWLQHLYQYNIYLNLYIVSILQNLHNKITWLCWDVLLLGAVNTLPKHTK